MQQPHVNIAVNAARKAGQIITRAFNHLDKIKFMEKGLNDFVTNIDKVCEEEIITIIQEAYPTHTFISEELDEIIKGDENTWIIDPLDGTSNFMRGLPHACISIAMKVGDVLQHAVIYDPFRDELFTASKGTGARLNDKRLRVSSNHDLGTAFLATGYPIKDPNQLEIYAGMVAKIFPKVRDIRSQGSAALDLAYVAAGRLDGYFETGLQEWDMAAGALIVREAGGFVTDFQGSEDYLQQGKIVATTPKIHTSLLKELA